MKGAGDPEYVDNGSERVESISSHVNGSSPGCGRNQRKHLGQRPSNLLLGAEDEGKSLAEEDQMAKEQRWVELEMKLLEK